MFTRRYLYGLHLFLISAGLAVSPSITTNAEDRSIDGLGNNLTQPDWGAAVFPFRRVAPASYSDGHTEPSGQDRPNARFISNRLFAQQESVPNHRGLSGFVYQFGQFISHDMQLTVSSTEQFFDIPLPEGETMLRRPIEVSRSVFDASTSVDTRPREQVNFTTSYLDGSMVYASDTISAEILRGGPARLGANLKTSDDINFDGQNLLPRDAFGLNFDASFVAGDTRVNENVNLTAMHTVFMREHNRLVDELSVMHPDWSEEQLYQRARKIVGAEIQSITYHEFLPALLGEHAPEPHGTYDATIEPTVSNEFAAVFLRVGHSMLPTHFQRVEENGAPSEGGPVTLQEASSNPAFIRFSEDLDALLRGLASEQQEEVDILLSDPLRGIGLGAIDIQRGRDHGLADYNTMRTAYGLGPVASYGQITSDPALQSALQEVYGEIDNIDAFVGALAEDHLDGAGVGPLTVAVLSEQFARLRDGDRFWFEIDNDFSSAEVATLHETRLSDIIRRNTGVRNIQDNVFFVGGGQVKPHVQAGDANQDLKFDQADLVKVQIAAKYLTRSAATWGEGDWDGAPGGEQGNPPVGNGLFDQIDIIAALGANTYLTGPYAAINQGGIEGDEQTSIIYDASTGELSVDAPASTELTSINLDSAASIFTEEPAMNLGGSFDNDSDNNIFKATFGSSFGSISFGNVAQTGLSEDFVLDDLTVIGSLAGGGDLGNVDLIYVPEPASAVMLFLGGLSLVARRRRVRNVREC